MYLVCFFVPHLVLTFYCILLYIYYIYDLFNIQLHAHIHTRHPHEYNSQFSATILFLNISRKLLSTNCLLLLSSFSLAKTLELRSLSLSLFPKTHCQSCSHTCHIHEHSFTLANTHTLQLRLCFYFKLVLNLKCVLSKKKRKEKKNCCHLHYCCARVCCVHSLFLSRLSVRAKGAFSLYFSLTLLQHKSSSVFVSSAVLLLLFSNFNHERKRKLT